MSVLTGGSRISLLKKAGYHLPTPDRLLPVFAWSSEQPVGGWVGGRGVGGLQPPNPPLNPPVVRALLVIKCMYIFILLREISEDLQLSDPM